MKPLVYIASAYTKGDPAINTRFQCEVFDRMLTDGIVTPYAPLVSHFQHTIFPRPYQDWIRYDEDMVARMDACVRLTATYAPIGYEMATSSGADGEVALCQSLGIPVFYSIDDLYVWARGKQ